MRLVFHIIWGELRLRRVIETPFTQKNGIAASLMDYARFNYIAQPGDKGVRFIRQMSLRSLCGELVTA
jgi:hypothetical protein